MNYFNNLFTTSLATILLVATFLPSSAQTIRRVTVGGAGNRSGSSWANASQLQAALAASTTPSDQIWIAGGIYKPHATDRVATFRVSAGVLVYGGFAGNEVALASRAGGATILSGDLLGDDGTRPVRPPATADQTAYNAARAVYDATRDDNSGTVVTLAGANVTLDELTITAGEGGNPASRNRGGGLYAGSGTAGATLTGCTFTGNEERGGGGAFFTGAATLTACTFTGNEAELLGGGVAFSGGTATLTACTFTGNVATNSSISSGGGAVFTGSATLTACTFTGNEATFRGGGAYFGGTATLTNCVLVGNRAGSGGGLLLLNSGGTVINSTLYNNTATSSRGGGIWVSFNDTDTGTPGVQSNPFTLRNSILVGNTARNVASGHQVRVHNTDAAHVATLQNNLIAGGADPMGTNQGVVYVTPGSGNITQTGTINQSNASVVFASIMASNANYLRLAASSPAVGAGNNDYVNNATPRITTDAAGNVRIQSGTVDLGAYESAFVALTPQNIRFFSPDMGRVGETITLDAVTNPGSVAITFQITDQAPASGTGNVATLAGTVLTLRNRGTVTITATIDAIGTYASATVTQTITVRPAGAAIFRVTTTGAGTRDGSSWANAMTLQVALATATTAGDQVWIEAGTYKPGVADDGNRFTTEQRATFSVSAGVLVYGGFEGDEASFMPDDPTTPANEDTRDRNATTGAFMHETILSGDLAGDDGTRPVQPAEGKDMTAYNAALAVYNATRDDNSYTVVTITGANVTLDGLTITAGQSIFVNRSAGLSADFGTTGATLTGCTFTNNESQSIGGAYFQEAATLTDCTFTDNTAGSGGGGARFASTATLTACTFTNNTSRGGGAGATFRGLEFFREPGPRTLTLTNCTFTDNVAENSGGGASFDKSATLTGCTFTGNEASFGGGASFDKSATLTGCTFTGNSSNEFASGGGVYLRGAATLTACTFTDNASGSGGGAYLIGTSSTLENCVLVGNTATNRGGGLSVGVGLGGEGTVINSTLYNNRSRNGGGLYVNGFSFTLQNSLLLDNTAEDAASGHQVYFSNINATDVATLQNNLIEGGTDPLGTDQGVVYDTPGAANITQTGTVDETDASVVFASTDAMNANYLRLKAGSPAVGAGNNDYLNNGTPDNTEDDIKTDAVGNARIQSGTVDLGAYESPFVSVAQTLVFTLAGNGISGAVIPLTTTSQDADGNNITADGLPAVTYTSSDNTIAEVRAVSGGGQELVLKAPGPATITASRGRGTAGGVTYVAASPVKQDIIVGEAPQTLTFVLAGSGISGNTISLTATSQDADGTDIADGLPAITYMSSDENVAMVRAIAEGGGQELVLLMNGTATITASRVGGTIEEVTYAAATPVTQDIMVSAAPQTLVFTLTGDLISGNTIPLTAISQDADGNDITAVAGLPAITYTSSEERVAEVRAVSGGGQELVLLEDGTAIITASRGGGRGDNGITYAAATAVTQPITVSAVTQSLTFTLQPDGTSGDEITLMATSQDAGGTEITGLPDVTFAITPGSNNPTTAGENVATLDAGTGVLTLASPGMISITASRGGRSG